jgi:hypothetical protein
MFYDYVLGNRMKLLLAIIAIVLSGNPLCAQEPPLPAKTETPTPTPSTSTSTTGPRPELNIPEIPLSVEPPKLVPDTSDSGPAHTIIPSIKNRTTLPLSELDAAFQKSPLAQAAEQQRLHLEWRQLQNRVANDPAVVAAKEATTRTKTDLEKREKLRAYYNIFYAHMQALASAPDVKKYLSDQKGAAIASLAQPRVRPTPTPRPTPH